MVTILLSVVGLLGLLFSGVEWALSRLEEAPDRRRNSLRSGAVGVAAIVAAFLSSSPLLGRGTSAAEEEAREIMRRGKPETLVTAILERISTPTLAQVQGERKALHTQRRDLAAHPPLYASNRRLYNQSDTLLGVAYQTLAQQWTLISTRAWNEAERKASVAQLRSEWETWQHQRDCALNVRADCAQLASLSGKDEFLRTWTRFMHPYIIELVRFETSAPELVNRSSQEYGQLSQLLGRGKEEVSAREMPSWADPLRATTSHLLQVALNVLEEEQGANRTGGWDSPQQSQAYTAVQEAFWEYFQAQRCLSTTSYQGC